ncbi:hypothetical protein [Terracidiphilus gabretensis]|uniref:hypothetical protein n=1 Tax=Terracidiphilus gabretensis TaxID=1577687 RepID=UPI00071B9E28|nr:hypothetical protein [Terracidiphilus gabretensis]
MRRPAIASALVERTEADTIHTLHAVLNERDRTPIIERALRHCKDAWDHAHGVAIEKGKTQAEALRMAQVAYKLALPKMDSRAAIKAHIAAVAQGIALEVFNGRDGSQLLYAAQVAMTLHQTKGTKK